MKFLNWILCLYPVWWWTKNTVSTHICHKSVPWVSQVSLEVTERLIYAGQHYCKTWNTAYTISSGQCGVVDLNLRNEGKVYVI